MKQPVSSTKRVKAGTSKYAAEAKRDAFVNCYLANGHNATQAAIAAGYSPKTAYSQGQRLLKDVETSAALAKAAETGGKAAGLVADRVVEQIRRVTEADPCKLFHPDGSPKRVHELDDDTAAAVSSVEVAADGSQKIKLCDKNSALNMALKHLGLYERDNAQRGENLVLIVNCARPLNSGTVQTLDLAATRPKVGAR